MLMSNPCETTTQTEIPFRDEEHPESTSVFMMLNQQRHKIIKCKIDGENSIFGNDTSFKKCDWLAIDVRTKREVYIELKGAYDVEDGVNQIKDTMNKLAEKKLLHEQRDYKSPLLKIGYIIHKSRTPSFETKNQKLIKNAKEKHKLIVRFRKTPHKEEIISVLK